MEIFLTPIHFDHWNALRYLWFDYRGMIFLSMSHQRFYKCQWWKCRWGPIFAPNLFHWYDIESSCYTLPYRECWQGQSSASKPSCPCGCLRKSMWNIFVCPLPLHLPCFIKLPLPVDFTQVEVIVLLFHPLAIINLCISFVGAWLC